MRPHISCVLLLSCSADEAVHFPVFTFSSGPTNSMRGAAFLSGLADAIVVDIGGTTTDIGVLRQGFPREASSQRKVCRGFSILVETIGGSSEVVKM